MSKMTLNEIVNRAVHEAIENRRKGKTPHWHATLEAVVVAVCLILAWTWFRS